MSSVDSVSTKFPIQQYDLHSCLVWIVYLLSSPYSRMIFVHIQCGLCCSIPNYMSSVDCVVQSSMLHVQCGLCCSILNYMSSVDCFAQSSILHVQYGLCCSILNYMSSVDCVVQSSIIHVYCGLCCSILNITCLVWISVILLLPLINYPLDIYNTTNEYIFSYFVSY